MSSQEQHEGGEGELKASAPGQDGQKKRFDFKKLFKTRIIDVIYIIIVLYLLFAYKADMQECNAAIKEPCKFCSTNGCCEYAYYDVLYEFYQAHAGDYPSQEISRDYIHYTKALNYSNVTE